MSNLRTDILEQKDFILQCIEEHKSKAFICKELKCKPETLNSYLDQMGIKYAGNQGLKGEKKSSQYKTAEEYANKESGVKSHVLKEKLLRDGIKEYRCERCNLTSWLGGPIPLELHHKDGNHYNNDFSNLELLCPNCHSLESNNSGAGVLAYQEKIKSMSKEKAEEKRCSSCGALLVKSKTGLCQSCYKVSSRTVERPDAKTLAQEIVESSFCAVGKKYGVSDNAIRKWCTGYNIPKTKNELIVWLKENE